MITMIIKIIIVMMLIIIKVIIFYIASFQCSSSLISYLVICPEWGSTSGFSAQQSPLWHYVTPILLIELCISIDRFLYHCVYLVDGICLHMWYSGHYYHSPFSCLTNSLHTWLNILILHSLLFEMSLES